MQNAVRQLIQIETIYEQGIVVKCEEETYTVETHSGTYEAKQAVSCLISPEPNDKVLLAGNHDEGFYVLSILERGETSKKTISFYGDVAFCVKDGRLTLSSQQGLNLTSGESVDITSPGLNVRTLKGEVHIHDLIFSGSFWIGQLHKIKVAINIVDSFVERLSQRIKRSYRTIEEVDRLRAGRLDYLIDKLLSLRGKYSMLTAKEDVKIDGERIHMG